MTSGGPSKGVPCVFPFTHFGKKYKECTLDSDGPWCSTKTDEEGVHIGQQGNWGICGPNCPIPGKPNWAKEICHWGYIYI